MQHDHFKWEQHTAEPDTALEHAQIFQVFVQVEKKKERKKRFCTLDFLGSSLSN